MQKNLIKNLTTIAVCLALLVVMLGAYTRLTDAGLGCPDWPGCYGRLVLPKAQQGLIEAQAQFPQIPIESQKAWTEMVHRYAAGTLALFIFIIALGVFKQRKSGINIPFELPYFLVVLVLFQALLGMWTVTLKLLPVVVMAHLLGGMSILACLFRFRVQMSSDSTFALAHWRPFLRIGVLIVFLQIALGGWVSANYAGISCIGFPKCSGFWVPDLHFSKGFNLFSPVGANYQGGLLDSEVRMSIQWIHRLGAIITAVYLFILSILMIKRSKNRNLVQIASIIALLVLVQFSLGLLNVMYLLPLSIAVAHNGVAALLLATVFSALHYTRRESVHGL